MKTSQCILLITFLLMIGNSVSNAQIQKGHLMVGADLGSMGLNLNKNNSILSFGVSPKVGYFVRDNYVIGGELNFSMVFTEQFRILNYGLGIFNRYYFGNAQENLINKSRFFMEANIGMSQTHTKEFELPLNTQQYLIFDIGIGAGMAYFITPNIGLETSLKYNGGTEMNNVELHGSLNFNLGLQIYLPTSKVKNNYNGEH